ncbi:MAG: hypothetical protein IJS47_04395 [Clostridia bacterium]|nr:hypothetical protein [Clostridia bacterium]
MEFKELVELLKVNPENTVFWARVFSGILLGYNGFRYISPKITQKLSAMKQHQEHVKANPIFKKPYAETLYKASVSSDYDLAQIDFDAIEKLMADGTGFMVRRDKSNKIGYLNAAGKEVIAPDAKFILEKRIKNYYGEEDIYIPRKEKR